MQRNSASQNLLQILRKNPLSMAMARLKRRCSVVTSSASANSCPRADDRCPFRWRMYARRPPTTGARRSTARPGMPVCGLRPVAGAGGGRRVNDPSKSLLESSGNHRMHKTHFNRQQTFVVWVKHSEYLYLALRSCLKQWMILRPPLLSPRKFKQNSTRRSMNTRRSYERSSTTCCRRSAKQ